MFALQHKPSGVFMPAPRGRAGGTYVEPFSSLKCQTTTPRLFSRRQDAESALKWWLAGEVQVSWTGSFGEEDREIVGQKVKVDRQSDDWEVVPVRLEVTR